MGKVIKFLVVLFSLPVFSQVNPKKAVTDTVAVTIDYEQYRKVALDSVRSIYRNQKKRIKEGRFANQPDAIATLFELKDIECVSIPMFKLRKREPPFGLRSCIEDYIDFKQDSGFQQVLMYKQNIGVNFIEIPNFEFGSFRIHQGEIPSTFDKTDYENNVLKHFIDAGHTNYIQLMSDILKGNSENTFFTIFGLRDLLFEIDKKTGLLYVNVLNHNLKRDRVIANEFLSKFVTVEEVNTIINGLHLPNKDYGLPKKSKKKRRSIVLKVK